MRVLVVEDDEDLATQIAEMLRGDNFAVDLADNGIEALERGLEEPFDAVILIIEGDAEVTIGGRGHAVTAGEIIRLPANIPHAVRATQRFKMLLIMIRAA